MAFFPSLKHRHDELELMDSGGASAAELGEALAFLETANVYLGGWSVLRERLEAWCSAWDKNEPITILDVGTGLADLPLRVLDWGRRRGLDVRVTAIDGDPSVLEMARRRTAGEPGLELLGADLRSFSAGGRRFTYVIGSLFLHHVPPADLTSTLKLCDRLATRGLIFSDLRRCASAYAGVWALTLGRGRVTHHDGPLSVRRAFRMEELEAAADEAGLGYLRARRGPFFRVILAGEKF